MNICEKSIGFVYLFICVSLVLFGCQESMEIEELKNKLILIEHRLNATSDRLWAILTYDTLLIDISEKGFGRIDANLGTFFIVPDDVQPFANGYKLLLRIGNPHSIQYSGIKMTIEWGKERATSPKINDFAKFDEYIKKYTEWQESEGEWKKQLKTKELSIIETLEPGAWTKVEITLSPATKDELGHLKLSQMKINKILLYKP